MTAGQSHDEETGWRHAATRAVSREDRPAPAAHPRHGDTPATPEPVYVHVAYRSGSAPLVWTRSGDAGRAHRPVA